jgi:hypothetical protein
VDMKTKYYTKMSKRFLELRLCELDWKTEQVASETYPAWHAQWLAKLDRGPQQEGVKRPRKDSKNLAPKRSKSVASVSNSVHLFRRYPSPNYSSLDYLLPLPWTRIKVVLLVMPGLSLRRPLSLRIWPEVTIFKSPLYHRVSIRFRCGFSLSLYYYRVSIFMWRKRSIFVWCFVSLLRCVLCQIFNRSCFNLRGPCQFKCFYNKPRLFSAKDVQYSGNWKTRTRSSVKTDSKSHGYGMALQEFKMDLDGLSFKYCREPSVNISEVTCFNFRGRCNFKLKLQVQLARCCPNAPNDLITLAL